jgi:hypothetical protein
MWFSLVWQGLLAGLVHFVAIGVLYGNPWIDRLYSKAQESSPAVRRWSSKPRYLVMQLAGTQVEVFILTFAFLWLRPAIGIAGITGSLTLGIAFAALRVYPRFWNMWIQTNYPRHLLAVEVINGTLGTLVIALVLHLF